MHLLNKSFSKVGTRRCHFLKKISSLIGKQWLPIVESRPNFTQRRKLLQVLSLIKTHPFLQRTITIKHNNVAIWNNNLLNALNMNEWGYMQYMSLINAQIMIFFGQCRFCFICEIYIVLFNYLKNIIKKFK